MNTMLCWKCDAVLIVQSFWSLHACMLCCSYRMGRILPLLILLPWNLSSICQPLRRSTHLGRTTHSTTCLCISAPSTALRWALPDSIIASSTPITVSSCRCFLKCCSIWQTLWQAIKTLEEIPYTFLFFKVLLFSLYVYFIILMRGSSNFYFSVN